LVNRFMFFCSCLLLLFLFIGCERQIVVNNHLSGFSATADQIYGKSILIEQYFFDDKNIKTSQGYLAIVTIDELNHGVSSRISLKRDKKDGKRYIWLSDELLGVEKHGKMNVVIHYIPENIVQITYFDFRFRTKEQAENFIREDKIRNFLKSSLLVRNENDGGE